HHRAFPRLALGPCADAAVARFGVRRSRCVVLDDGVRSSRSRRAGVDRFRQGRGRLRSPRRRCAAAFRNGADPCYKTAGKSGPNGVPMYPPLSPPLLLAAGLLLALAACGGKKDQVYIEKPVDDL